MSSSIFISGASKGIGLAIARKFYQEGFTVIICARGKEGLEAAKAEMPDLRIFQCDISDPQAVVDLSERIKRDFGPLTVLVNNGGLYKGGNVHDTSPEEYHKLMATNVDSAYYFTQAFVPDMKQAQKGTIVNLCSIASLNAMPGGGLYGMTKFALLGFSRNLRLELKDEQIRVITLLPGAVKTPSWDHMSLPEERFIPASDIAELVWTSCKLSNSTVVEEILVRPLPGDL